MDLQKEYMHILEIIPQPAFAVAEGRIVGCNQLCRNYLPNTGAEISGMLLTGEDEYCEFQEGCLCLRVRIGNQVFDATVTPLENAQLFRLEQAEVPAEVKAMALMSSQMRQSISTLSILGNSGMGQTPEAEAFRHEICRIHRMLNNAANAEFYLSNRTPSLYPTDVSSVLRELAEESATLLEQAGLHLSISLPPHPVIALADEQGLRQAVYNLLSNAAKYAPAGSTITCKVSRSGDRLHISITDQGEGISPEDRIGVFSRFSRRSTLEEGRKNLGLGLALVRAVAAAHGGIVLMDSPQGSGTRVTMTLSLHTGNQTVLRASRSILVRSPNEGLIMLADVLPHSAYKHQQ